MIASLLLLAATAVPPASNPTPERSAGPQPGRDYAALNVCKLVPGDAIARAFGGKLAGMRPFSDKSFSRCVYFIVPLGVERAAFYSTAPLQDTLAELIDFDYVNAKHARLTLGAVNVRTGEMHYSDSRDRNLCATHVMASGALPPAFPAVRVDGEPYWDGGVYSNTPIEVVLDEKPRRDSLILAANMWHPRGPEPETIWQVLDRHKDIQYASRALDQAPWQRQCDAMDGVIVHEVSQ